MTETTETATETTETATETAPQPPLLRVVRGEPTPEELAALIVVVTARSAAQTAVAADTANSPVQVSAWTDRSRLVRSMPIPGPSAWRSSTWG